MAQEHGARLPQVPWSHVDTVSRSCILTEEISNKVIVQGNFEVRWCEHAVSSYRKLMNLNYKASHAL